MTPTQGPTNFNRCSSKLGWKLDMCFGCKCKFCYEDGKSESFLIDSQIFHHASKSAPGFCGEWFTRIDNTFRQYFALVRAALLAQSTACCSPWAEGKARLEDTMTHDMQKAYSREKDNWRNNAVHTCKGEKFAATSTTTTTRTAGVATFEHPVGFESVTRQAMSTETTKIFNSQCTKHAKMDIHVLRNDPVVHETGGNPKNGRTHSLKDDPNLHQFYAKPWFADVTTTIINAS